MKLIRLTDDRYVLVPDRNLPTAAVKMISAQFDEWQRGGGTDPAHLLVFGMAVEYEDRRRPPSDVDDRLAAIEDGLAKLLHHWALDQELLDVEPDEPAGLTVQPELIR